MTCSECGKTFAHKLRLERHFRQMHQKDKLHYCSLCGRGFLYPSLVQQHVCKHPEASPPVNAKSCPICGKLFAATYDMNAHAETHNPNRERKFSCDYCQMTFTTLSYAKKHMRRVHKKAPMSTTANLLAI